MTWRECPHLGCNGVEVVRHHHSPAHLHSHLPQPLAQEVRVGVLNMTFQDLITNHYRVKQKLNGLFCGRAMNKKVKRV